MQTAFLIVSKLVCKWIISMIPLSGISVRVTYMYTKMRKMVERFLTWANVNWTNEIKHQKSYLSFVIPLIVTCPRDSSCIVFTFNLQIGALQ